MAASSFSLFKRFTAKPQSTHDNVVSPECIIAHAVDMDDALLCSKFVSILEQKLNSKEIIKSIYAISAEEMDELRQIENNQKLSKTKKKNIIEQRLQVILDENLKKIGISAVQFEEALTSTLEDLHPILIEIINGINHSAQEENTLILTISGSNRQTRFLDFECGLSRQTGSSAVALFYFTKLLKQFDKRICLDKFMLEDTLPNTPEGINFTFMMKYGLLAAYISDAYERDRNIEIDHSKVILFYILMHRFATLYPTAKSIALHFYDDDSTNIIFNALRDVYGQHSELIPANITLYLHQYKGASVEKLARNGEVIREASEARYQQLAPEMGIKGTGNIDLAYRKLIADPETVRTLLSEMETDMSCRGIITDLEKQQKYKVARERLVKFIQQHQERHVSQAIDIQQHRNFNALQSTEGSSSSTSASVLQNVDEPLQEVHDSHKCVLQ